MKSAITAIILLLIGQATMAQTPEIKAKDRAVKVRSEIANSTQIKIAWAEERHAAKFIVYRKEFGNDSSAWSNISGDLAGTATEFIDTNPSSGARYEYRVIKHGEIYRSEDTLNPFTYTAYGYTAGAIGIAP